MGALSGKEELGASVSDPRRGELGLLFANTLHRAGKHDPFI